MIELEPERDCCNDRFRGNKRFYWRIGRFLRIIRIMSQEESHKLFEVLCKPRVVKLRSANLVERILLESFD